MTGTGLYSAGIDIRRQILTTKVDPRAVRIEIDMSKWFVAN